MIREIADYLLDNISDEYIKDILNKGYPENLFVLYTAYKKMGMIPIVEASIRANKGVSLERPYGSYNNKSFWEDLFLSPCQLFKMPIDDIENISIKKTIGKRCEKPLNISMPIIITGMSYGLSLCKEAKIALGKGASLAGTATNTGESSIFKEERENSNLLIAQYNRGGYMKREDLKFADAIEIQLGQGAYGGGVTSSTKNSEIDNEVKGKFNLGSEDAVVYARMKEVKDEKSLIQLVEGFKREFPVPVGIKIAASNHLEKELEIIIKTGCDFIAIDGAEGGSAVAPPTLEDCLGLPSIYAIARCDKYLKDMSVRDKFDLILAGGLKTPGDFLKAIALGADAVYIGSIALIAIIQDQITKAVIKEPTPQLVLYNGKLRESFDTN